MTIGCCLCPAPKVPSASRASQCAPSKPPLGAVIKCPVRLCPVTAPQSPRDKLVQILNCCKVINAFLAARRAGAGEGVRGRNAVFGRLTGGSEPGAGSRSGAQLHCQGLCAYGVRPVGRLRGAPLPSVAWRLGWKACARRALLSCLCPARQMVVPKHILPLCMFYLAVK